MADADRGDLAFLPKDWLPHLGAVPGLDGIFYANVFVARENSGTSQPRTKQLEKENVYRLATFLHSTGELQDVLETDGCIITTSQLNEYMNRGDHPILAPMELCVYPLWVHRVEASNTQAGKVGQVVLFVVILLTNLHRVTSGSSSY